MVQFTEPSEHKNHSKRPKKAAISLSNWVWGDGNCSATCCEGQAEPRGGNRVCCALRACTALALKQRYSSSRKPLKTENSTTTGSEKSFFLLFYEQRQHWSNVSEVVFFICSQNWFVFFLNPVIILLYNTIISYCDICLPDKEQTERNNLIPFHKLFSQGRYLICCKSQLNTVHADSTGKAFIWNPSAGEKQNHKRS